MLLVSYCPICGNKLSNILRYNLASCKNCESELKIEVLYHANNAKLKIDDTVRVMSLREHNVIGKVKRLILPSQTGIQGLIYEVLLPSDKLGQFLESDLLKVLKQNGAL